MAEPSKCPYCHIGIPLWFFFEEETRYILRCSHCGASGNYQAAQVQTEARIAELEAELKVSDELLKDRERLLEAIPPCSAHGKCVPHAIKWIEKMKRLAGANEQDRL